MELPRKRGITKGIYKQLKWAGVATKELVTFYIICIRLIMEYVCSEKTQLDAQLSI